MRRGERVFAHVNACPHSGVPLDWTPHHFLSTGSTLVVCAVHGAEFRVVDGVCLRGPCKGDRLEAVRAEAVDGVILVPDDAGL